MSSVAKPQSPPKGPPPAFVPAAAHRGDGLRPGRRPPGGPLAAALGALREAADALAEPGATARLHEFADLVTMAREPETVETALVALAAAVSRARRVELVLDRDERVDPGPRLMALWPDDPASLAMSAEQVEALGYPLCLGLRCGDHYQMTLRLYARPGTLKRGRWPQRVVRRLTTVCALAAAAERGLHASQRARLEAPVEAAAAVRDATFLNAVLPYALAQAARHREPLTVLCLDVDDLPALTRAHGPAPVEQAVARVADAVAHTLRGSDVVARLDDDRVFVVLPNAGGADALKVAGVVRTAVAAACRPADGLPELNVAIGVACYPHDARDMLGLLHAADDAMTRARAGGPGRIAAAERGPAPGPAPSSAASRVDPGASPIPPPRAPDPRPPALQ